MKRITKYFRNAVLAALQCNFEYKDGLFETLTFSEVYEGKVEQKKINFLWKGTAEYEADSPEEKECQKNVIIALKTISSIFTEGNIQKTDIKEMTSIFYLPAKVSRTGVLSKQDEKLPWIPREYLSPMLDPIISIGSAEDYDKFLENSTDRRNKIDSWETYFNYAKDMFKEITKTDFLTNNITNANKIQIITDGKFYIFEDTTVNSTFHILQTYNHLLNNQEIKPQLYAKITNGLLEPSKKLSDQLSCEKMKGHCGQMGGEYPLSPSQREALNCFQEIEEGEVLAVNGPPGSGKTTLLQSLVAYMYVNAALEREEAPMVIATSTNNQAVTNIIESFEKISSIGIENLEKRWIEGVHSFALYFPTKGRISEAEKKNYHYTSVNGIGFAEEIESDENRAASKELFLAEFSRYFGMEEDFLKACNEHIHSELIRVEKERVNCIELLNKIKKIIGKQSCSHYINKLKVEVKDREKQINEINGIILEYKKKGKHMIVRRNEWRKSYNSLPWYVRLLKFIFKKKIEKWSYENMQYEELNFLKRGMRIDEIEKRYHQQIEANDESIKSIQNKLKSVKAEKEGFVSAYNVICQQISEVKETLMAFSKYKISIDKKDYIEDIDIVKVNNYLDKVRYVEFWLAVHYYESLWLIEDNEITENQKGKTYENVLNIMYRRLAMLTPCMVMTCFMLPKQFLAYKGNKQYQYMYEYADLLIVDEAGQISPEIGAASFAFAKKAVVVGDEQQIPPVWSIPRALDVSIAIANEVISNKEEFELIQNNGLNCSESSIMRVASLSCPYEKYGKGLFLSEHRRCYNEIIQYCNDLVYKGKLEPLRGIANRDAEYVLKEYLPPMGYKQIDTPYSKRKGTSRQNLNEAIEIVNWLEQNYSIIIEKYREQALSKDEEFLEKNVIGIITPFKSQSILIQKVIHEKLPVISSNVSVGTVHIFQGAERKIIIFSSVYGCEEGCYFINANESLMNVAVSRAKDSFLIFGDRGCLVGGSKSAGVMLKKATSYKIV